MTARFFAVLALTLWVGVMCALAIGPRALEYWRASDVIQPIPVKVDEIKRPPETVVEKMQERVEPPPLRPAATVDECPAPAALEPLATPVPKSKIKRRKLSVVKKAPASAPVLVGGQPQ